MTQRKCAIVRDDDDVLLSGIISLLHVNRSGREGFYFVND